MAKCTTNKLNVTNAGLNNLKFKFQTFAATQQMLGSFPLFDWTIFSLQLGGVLIWILKQEFHLFLQNDSA